MWTTFFDRIVVISLPERKQDRLIPFIEQCIEYDIPIEVFEATKEEDGRLGVYLSMRELFIECLEGGIDNLLCFEDDALFVLPPKATNELIGRCLEQLPRDWDTFSLGPNALIPFEKFYSSNLLKIRMSYALHAVAYSRVFMEKFISLPYEIPVDTMIAKRITPDGNCYCSFPFLCTQRVSRSNIDNGSPILPGVERFWNEELKTVDWGKMICENYDKAIQHLL